MKFPFCSKSLEIERILIKLIMTRAGGSDVCVT